MKQTFIKEFLFFVGIFFFLLCVHPMCNVNSGNRYLNRYLPVILPVFFTAIIFTWYKLGNIKDSCQTDKFHFEVTPSKRCDGGAYMTQSGEDHEFCKQLLSTQAGINEYDDVNCGPGFPGRPLPYFEYTPETNDRWESDRCTQGPTPLQVL